MNVVDSSAWLEYFADGPNAGAFAQAVEATQELIVPTICLYEVFRAVLRQRGESAAFSAIALMRQGRVIPLTERIALLAADLSLHTRLPMADSVILATARVHGAHIWTQDADFDGLEGVTFVPKG
jgi:toxin FitB